MKSYHIALESFSSMALDQPTSDRLTYKSAAMEAVTGADSGMVLDKLYRNMTARSTINFGKIPESQGDLTKFVHYRTIKSTLSLLNRQLAEYKIVELEQSQLLHDNIIRLHEDFAYGFKVDSQFLKTTYNTMVYSLVEMLNLCNVVYVDMLKAQAEGRQFDYKPYSDLLLTQNVARFNEMVKSGEWSTMMLSIRKDAKNLISVVYDGSYNDKGSLLHTLAGITGTVGIPGLALHGLANSKVAKASMAARGDTNVNISDLTAAAKAGWTKVTSTTGGKIGIAIVIIIAVLFIIRQITFAIFRGAYKLDDMIDDQNKILKAHIDNYYDANDASKAPEKQRAMYERLAGIQEGIRTKILKGDAEGRKAMKESNAKDFSASAMRNDPVSTEDASDEVSLG
jgi:hypothetical protein